MKKLVKSIFAVAIAMTLASCGSIGTVAGTGLLYTDLAQGEMVEVYADTLHFCPCEVTKNGFSCIVGLQRGTNLPLEPEQKKGTLWAANKWLLGHEANTSLIERGAFSGIYGENWEINPIG